MVQIATTVIITTMVVAPILGAPVTETRKSRKAKADQANVFVNIADSGSVSHSEQQHQQRDLTFEEYLEARGLRNKLNFHKFEKAVSVAGTIADGISTVTGLRSMFRPQPPIQRRRLTHEDLLEAREKVNKLNVDANIEDSTQINHKSLAHSQDIQHSRIENRISERAGPQPHRSGSQSLDHGNAAANGRKTTGLQAAGKIGTGLLAGIGVGAAFAPFIDKIVALHKPNPPAPNPTDAKSNTQAMARDLDLDSDLLGRSSSRSGSISRSGSSASRSGSGGLSRTSSSGSAHTTTVSTTPAVHHTDRVMSGPVAMKIGQAAAGLLGSGIILGGTAIFDKLTQKKEEKQQQQQRRDLFGVEAREPSYEHLLNSDNYIRDVSSLDELD